MKVVIFGASGGTGVHVVKQALEAGHEVTAFVRDPSRLPVQHERLRVLQGDVVESEKVAEAVAGQDAVLSALGPAKPAFTAMTVGAQYIIAAMQRHGVRRLITLTGAGVADSNDRPGVLNRVITFLLKRINPEVLADAQRHVDRVRASDLDWTVVRVGRLLDRPGTGELRVGWVGIGTRPFISRADAATFMLNQLTDTAHHGQAPMISN